MKLKSIKIGRIHNIDIELHYSWFFIFILLAWALSSAFFPLYYPGLTWFEYWALGIASSFLLFVSVLIHELTHSFVAQRGKIGVEKITLFFFGGVAQITGENISPSREFKMAIAGPLISFVLAAIFYGLLKISPYVYITAICFYLSRINFILAVFNLVPGYPLDGGRMLRAVLWAYFQDIKKATKYAAIAGKAFGILLIIMGVLGMFYGMGTLWFVLIGAFLYFLAKSGYEQLIIKEILSKMKVKQVLRKSFVSVNENTSIAKLFSYYFLRYSQDGFPVMKDNKIIGLVTSECLKSTPKSKWLKKKAKDVMLPVKKNSKRK